MPVKERKSERKKQKRERILEAAEKLFSQKSYHEVMMEDVAKMINVAKGTVYNYFTSKEELYFSIMSFRMENLLNLLKEKIRADHNSIDALRLFVFHAYMFMIKHKNFFLMYKKESLDSESDYCEELKKLDVQLKNQLANLITNGVQGDIFREVDEEFAVNSIMGSIFATVERDIRLNLNEDEKKIERDMLFEFILHALHSNFSTSDVLPLKNKTIVLTRTVEQSKESALALTRLGAEVIVFPTLEIIPPSNWDEFDLVMQKPENIDFIIFTSAHAVQMFRRRCEELKINIDYENKIVVAVGNKTSSLCKEFDIPVSVIPSKFNAEGVVEELSKFEMTDKFVFIPRSAIGREELPKGLKELGAVIKSIPVYRVSLPTKEHINANLEVLHKSKPELFIFTSPSTFENFLQIVNVVNPAEYFKGYDIAAIGPTTRTAIENRRVKVTIMPEEYTIDGLIKKIIEYYNS